MTVQKILKQTYLLPLDLEVLLSYTLKKTREYIFAHPETRISDSQLKKLRKLIERRQKGEPVAYLTGQREFFGLNFLVNKNVLIPRPETELLVEKALDKISKSKESSLQLAVIDVGTGSGNIIISILQNLPAKKRESATFMALDISKKALSAARLNAQRHNFGAKVDFAKSDILKFILKNQKIILNRHLHIAANLPYLRSQEYEKCSHEIRKYEPLKALISQNNGLGHYRRLLRQVRKIVSQGVSKKITLYFEISPWQKKYLIQEIKVNIGRTRTSFFKDLAGRTRLALIEIEAGKLTKKCLA